MLLKCVNVTLSDPQAVDGGPEQCNVCTAGHYVNGMLVCCMYCNTILLGVSGAGQLINVMLVRYV